MGESTDDILKDIHGKVNTTAIKLGAMELFGKYVNLNKIKDE